MARSEMSTVISIRIKRELKEEAERLGINFKELFEEALKEAIEKEKKKRLRRAIKIVSNYLSDINDEELVRIIRNDRDSR